MSLQIKYKQECSILSFDQLTPEEQSDVSNYDSVEESSFFRFRGNVYDLNNFMCIGKNGPMEFSEYTGYASDSFFSGVLVNTNDFDIEDTLIAALYLS